MKKQVLITLAILGTCAVAAEGYHLLQSAGGRTKIPTPDTPAQATRDRVSLSGPKLAQAGIETAIVGRQKLQPIRMVPGRIEYNGTRHVSVKSPSDGLMQKVAVIVGDRVEAGQLLAVVNSPELGERRADVLKQQAELELAQRERDWWQQVLTNVDDLLASLKRHQEFATLEKDFRDRVLGDYRRDIFSAYSKYQTAETVNANLKTLIDGVISQRVVLEQASARDSAAATYHAACEQAAFDVRQKVGKAQAVFNDASRRLAVARERLTWFTGQSLDQIGDLSKEESLSTWPIVAPFAATVEDLMIAASERVRQGDDVLLLADTTRLWVQADIRDKDWSALTLSAGQQIQVQTPALPHQSLDATIAFIGRTVNTETRAMPLVADIRNDQRLLKPGMFVRVLLPDGNPREALAVPDSAINHHEGRTFVFVTTETGEFIPRDVEVGITVEPWVEITSGLTVGEQVAVKGTFILKSELLLEPEE